MLRAFAIASPRYETALKRSLGDKLAQSIELAWNIESIQKLYNKLTQTKVKDSSELRELRVALSKK